MITNDWNEHALLAMSHTFVLRVEWSLSKPVLRGYLLNLQSGQKYWFQDLTGIPDMLRQAIGRLDDRPPE